MHTIATIFASIATFFGGLFGGAPQVPQEPLVGATSVLHVVQGGTGASTLTGCLSGNGTSAITGSGTCNISNASVSSIATNNGITGGTITTTGTIGLAATSQGVLSNTVNASTVPTSHATSTLYTASPGISMGTGLLGQIENRSFTASSTNPSVWVGTTTIPLEVGYGEVWNNIKCFTDVGTLNVQFGYGTASTSMFNASTTIGTVTATPNNTMTVGNKVKVDIGTPAGSVTNISCTVNDTI